MVSIIIPTLNEELNIVRLLDSIKMQIPIGGDTQYEVLVIDNGSNDKTVEISRQMGAKVYQRPNDSIADLRNFGAINSRGEFLIFSDADNIFTENVLRTVVDIFSNENWHVIGPDGLVPLAPASWMQKIWYFHTKRFNKPRQSLSVKNLSSGFFAIRRDAFEEVGGFNGVLSVGEDSDLSFRLKQKGKMLLRTNRIVVHNNGQPANMFDFLKREFWHGDSIGHVFIHRNIDVLTIYLILHLVGIVSAVICIVLFNQIISFLIILILLTIAPFFKAFKKTNKINKKLLELAWIYFIYLSVRSVALLKI